MKFVHVINNTGLNPEEFENSANIEINLYDGKNRITSDDNEEDELKYVEPLFKHNEGSLKNFQNFLTGLEKETIESMNVKIDIDTVILFYKSPRAIVFLRKPSMDPMDYME